MRLLVLTINYAPEPTGFAPHVAALCASLAEHGHQVSVITGFPFAPYWARWPEYRGSLVKRARMGRVDVTRVTHFVPSRAGQMVQRLLMEASFCLAAALVWLFRRPDLDLILYVGAQPSIAMLARLLAAACRVPYVVAVNDLAAKAAGDVGIVRAAWLQRLLETFEYAAYQNASGAIVLCSAFREALAAHRYPPERIRLIRSPVNTDLIRPVDSGEQFRRAHDLLPTDFVVLCSGSMGLKQGLLDVVEAARQLRAEQADVRWILVGDGELKPLVAQKVAEHGLGGAVRLWPLQPEAQMAAMFSSADVLLLSQVSAVKDTVIPSKLLTYMAAGRPVLAAVNPGSQAAQLVREAEGGLVVQPEDPAALAAGLGQLRADPSARREMGRRNRAYAEQHFDQRRVLAAQQAFLAEIANAAWNEVPNRRKQAATSA